MRTLQPSVDEESRKLSKGEPNLAGLDIVLGLIQRLTCVERRSSHESPSLSIRVEQESEQNLSGGSAVAPEVLRYDDVIGVCHKRQQGCRSRRLSSLSRCCHRLTGTALPLFSRVLISASISGSSESLLLCS